MPDVVQKTLTPLLPKLSKKTLRIMLSDLDEGENMPGLFGDESIDKPGWISFREKVLAEFESRVNQ